MKPASLVIFVAMTIRMVMVMRTKIGVPRVIVYFQELLLVSACQHASSPGLVPRGVPKNPAILMPGVNFA